MPYAETNNIKIFYETFGNGKPILMVHGFGSSRFEWFVQVGALSQRFKVIIFDNRGAGKSDRPDIPYTMEMFADDMAGLLDFLKIEKSHIIGASLGGMIVQNYILKYPEKVNKVVLINTFPGFPNTQGLNIFKNGLIDKYYGKLKDPAKAFFDTARNGYTRNFIKEMKADPKKKFFGLFSAEDIIKNSITDMATPQDIENSANAIAGHDVRNRLLEVKNKTLIICGEKDKISPIMANEQIYRLIPNSQFKIIPNAGHDSKLEKAPEINETILKFLLE